MKKLLFAAAFAALLPSIGGCNNGGSSTTTSPSAPTVTDTFTGTVQVGSIDFHNFTVTQAGSLAVTLTAAGPPSTIWMGLAVGSGGSSCSFSSTSETVAPAGPTAQLSFTVNPGTLCVEVLDIGNQVNPINYTVTVAHP